MFECVSKNQVKSSQGICWNEGKFRGNRRIIELGMLTSRKNSTSAEPRFLLEQQIQKSEHGNSQPHNLIQILLDNARFVLQNQRNEEIVDGKFIEKSKITSESSRFFVLSLAQQCLDFPDEQTIRFVQFKYIDDYFHDYFELVLWVFCKVEGHHFQVVVQQIVDFVSFMEFLLKIAQFF